MTRYLLYISFLCYCLAVAGKSSVPLLNITEFGAVPNSRQSANPAVEQAIAKVRKQGGGTIVFPKGRYDFFQDFCHPDSMTIAFYLLHTRNVTIDGQGSEFIFHGSMRVCKVEGASNTILKNFTVDWERPYISQAEIIAKGDDYLDLSIDPFKYPFVIENRKIYFVGEGWKSGINGHINMWDKATGTIAYRTRDILSPEESHDKEAGSLWGNDVELIRPGIVRFHGPLFEKQMKVGYLITFTQGNTYKYTGIELAQSTDTRLENILLYHTLSNGIYANKCTNITLMKVCATPNTREGRVFSTVNDASHFTCCRGQILIDGCNHAGQGDDFMNVRGINSVIQEQIDPQTLRCERGWFIDPGDELWHVSLTSLQREHVMTVKSILQDPNVPETYIVKFTAPLPKGIRKGDVLENKSWYPDLTVRNCHFQKRNRARGMLVTTPGKVLIENNLFETAGTAILIEGDLANWFESGGVRDVTIRDNRFENCVTSGNENGSYWEWGQAPITVSPSFQPKSEKDLPYHHNIVIENNSFKAFDAPILYARSVGNLTFKDNKIRQTYDYPRFLWQKSIFYLDGCRKVKIIHNDLDRNFCSRVIETYNMSRKDLTLKNKIQLQVVTDWNNKVKF